MRAVWLVLGAVTTALALLLSTSAIWNEFARASLPTETTGWSRPFRATSLKIEVGEGDIGLNVLAGEAGEVVANRTMEWSRDKPVVTEKWGDGTLRLDATCSGSDPRSRPRCQVFYDVFVPPEASVEATTGSGPLNVSGLYGDVRVTSAAGDLGLVGVAGAVWARSGTGEIRARELSGGQVDAETGEGSVNLSFSGRPTSVKAVVRASGDVNLSVPGGSYDVTSDAEESRIDVKREPGSARKIIARTPDGSVFVCCRR
ncbi:DUF4097 family beta strand repeat-containing protein [Nonomuraea sp. NPDC000554]|uniref:DUF4097 family beta strand repeat-containing protein n=1 Tax=Nonomuraea sp. NPDC000554 TaxID=3154259 RepID=UPI003328181C